MANKKSFTGWCFQWYDGSLALQVYQYKKDLIEDWSSDEISWRTLVKNGNRAVKVEVKIIERDQ